MEWIHIDFPVRKKVQDAAVSKEGDTDSLLGDELVTTNFLEKKFQW